MSFWRFCSADSLSHPSGQPGQQKPTFFPSNSRVRLAGTFDPATERDPADGVLVDITEASIGGGLVRGQFRFDLEGDAYRLGLRLHDADLAMVARDANEPGPPAGPLPGLNQSLRD